MLLKVEVELERDPGPDEPLPEAGQTVETHRFHGFRFSAFHAEGAFNSVDELPDEDFSKILHVVADLYEACRLNGVAATSVNGIPQAKGVN
jgi:hypothetical protein